MSHKKNVWRVYNKGVLKYVYLFLFIHLLHVVKRLLPIDQQESVLLRLRG